MTIYLYSGNTIDAATEIQYDIAYREKLWWYCHRHRSVLWYYLLIGHSY